MRQWGFAPILSALLWHRQWKILWMTILTKLKCIQNNSKRISTKIDCLEISCKRYMTRKLWAESKLLRLQFVGQTSQTDEKTFLLHNYGESWWFSSPHKQFWFHGIDSFQSRIKYDSSDNNSFTQETSSNFETLCLSTCWSFLDLIHYVMQFFLSTSCIISIYNNIGRLDHIFISTTYHKLY